MVLPCGEDASNPTRAELRLGPCSAVCWWVALGAAPSSSTAGWPVEDAVPWGRVLLGRAGWPLLDNYVVGFFFPMALLALGSMGLC